MKTNGHLLPSLSRLAMVLMLVSGLTKVVLSQHQDSIKLAFFTDIDAAFHKARNEGVAELAPRFFSRASALYKSAQSNYDKGERIDKIRKQINEAANEIRKALAIAKESRVMLSELFTVRQHVLSNQEYIGLAPKGFAEAERKYQEAISKAEGGDKKSSLSNAEKAIKLYRQMTVKALLAGPVKDAYDLLNYQNGIPDNDLKKAQRALDSLTKSLNAAQNEKVNIDTLNINTLRQLEIIVPTGLLASKKKENLYRILELAALRFRTSDWILRIYGASSLEVAEIKRLFQLIPQEYKRSSKLTLDDIPSSVALKYHLLTLINRYSKQLRVSSRISLLTLTRHLSYHHAMLGNHCPLMPTVEILKLSQKEFNRYLRTEAELCGANGISADIEDFKNIPATAGLPISEVGQKLAECINSYIEGYQSELSCENDFAEGEQAEEWDPKGIKKMDEFIDKAKEENANKEQQLNNLKTEEKAIQDVLNNSSLSDEDRASLEKELRDTQDKIAKTEREIHENELIIEDMERQLKEDTAEVDRTTVETLLPATITAISGTPLSTILGGTLVLPVPLVKAIELKEKLRQNHQDCIAQAIAYSPAKGASIYFLVQGTERPTTRRRPPSLEEVLDHCMCEALSPFEGTSPHPEGLGLQVDRCLSEEDKLRMDCLENPFGPDDTIKPECMGYLEQDNGDWQKTLEEKGCEFALCPEGHLAVGLDEDLYGECSGCGVTQDIVSRLLPENCVCAEIYCTPGQDCVCDPTTGLPGCEEPMQATTPSGPIPLVPKRASGGQGGGPYTVKPLSDNSKPYDLQINPSLLGQPDPSTTIKFNLPITQKATLAIYDTEGHPLRTFMDGAVGKGEYSLKWDGKDEAGNSITSGTYVYVLTAGNRVFTKQMEYR